MTVRHRILHLSDTHLNSPDVDASAALARILYDARFVPKVDLVVVSGDIADDGSTEGCAGVREQVGRFCAERGIPHVYCTGNHDTREAFAAALGSGHLAADSTDMGTTMAGASGERAAVSIVAGLRVVTLDSLVPGHVHGHLDPGQLVWLREVLAEPAAAGTVLVLHHPPIAVPTSPIMDTVNLRNAGDLADAVQGTDVHAILCGHFHLQLSGLLRGIPVWVTPGVVTRIDFTAPPRWERAVVGAGATVVDLGGPASPLFHVLHARDPRAGEQVYLVDAVSGEDVVGEKP
ncbi:3',5'-cyclic AMP phosphodiesterase CpdA [Actinopolymorpha cephalotaxi]|uniref:3',5'-cyclic AMP phosphodiesterase CpdA n=1 Tax=Actinopolymorpha cephalotaxi TaxID=504797 RepID=A0A1I2UIN7_9ACTN|nr:metallophosphoesterase [Actinopolymorpha cephalotaxi]NYH86558.1 3',5'-cyclic AMP phosphodiesterase CpdA [Actinopolymorpha cephalotaxi]SFG75517.1 3',5'-cyclic AMP phosphodiesterase CpdA [Actinopolymorpha cephalotaxi]